MPTSGSIPQRPYLVRAMHAWITDSGHTPHVVVDAAVEGVNVPQQFVRDGKIVLNISSTAVSGLEIGNEALTFRARFSGSPWLVHVPLRAVLGIYSRETGRGMIFSEDDAGSTPDEPPPDGGDGAPATPQGARKPRLTVVK
ncbi:MAG: ClpXP protease specificity-enhancing factor [Gammaproteobacteria bacterium]|nr:MAG: ClpXP protease specificity-enhancing factor [Gammaproteobacteria bacterium]